MLTISFDLGNFESVEICPISDVHIGNPLCREGLFEDIIMPSNNGTPRLYQRTMTYVLTGAFLNYGDYAERSSMRPSTIAMPKIFIKQARHKNSTNYIYTEVVL